MSGLVGTCAECVYFDDSGDHGMCRRHSPTPIAVKTGDADDGTCLTVIGIWPAASPDDSCGEWQGKVQA